MNDQYLISLRQIAFIASLVFAVFGQLQVHQFAIGHPILSYEPVQESAVQRANTGPKQEQKQSIDVDTIEPGPFDDVVSTDAQEGQIPKPPNYRQHLLDATEANRVGDYAKVVDLANAGVVGQPWNENWPMLLIEAHLQTGQYRLAKGVVESALERFGNNLKLRLKAIEIYKLNNEERKAKEQLRIIDLMIQQAPWRYTTATELVALGEYFLLQGEDPKLVLEACFDQSLKLHPEQSAAHIATAEMALGKGDAKVASQSLAKALAKDDASPKVYYLLYKAWSGTDPKRATDYLKRSLEINSKFTPSLVALAEQKLNEESFEDAEIVLSEVEAVNPNSSQLWALRAVAAHLQGMYAKEGEYRAKALEAWPLNPEVDFTIGRHLGMHYRFKESVEYQRRALKMDPNYVPALTQLAQDLLRLGDDTEGWQLVERVRQSNPYDVTIYNLKQLQKAISTMATLESPGFVVRMDAKEATVYGQEVLELLSEARSTLTAKYEVELEEPIYVEIFPRQKDFAIRTFGMPGGEGFLGVCFGRLITANSPAALNVDSNWKSVLWHEYCHVVTLQKTKNKMPRWLSEGISVYEEKQRDKTWGQSIDPTYRRMMLGDDFFPISDLSSAFMKAKSPLHLQFAYFESSVAVEYFIEQFGLKALLQVLDDLAVGMPMNDAIRRAPGSLEALDNGFKIYANELASNLGTEATWAEPSNVKPEMLLEWYAQNPNSVATLEHKAKLALAAEDWSTLLLIASQWRELWPEDSRENGVYSVLAQAHRGLGDLPREREVLVELVQRCSTAMEALERLCELDKEESRWNDLLRWSQAWIDVAPLNSAAQRYRAQAAGSLERRELELASWKAILASDPIDEAFVRFQVAKALMELGQQDLAKEEVLTVLEDSPRFADALALLLRINHAATVTSQKGSSDEGKE